MLSLRFWLAVWLSGCLHAVPFALLWHGMATPAELMAPYGNSDREGFDVETVALDPGAWRQGDQNTPGGDDVDGPIPAEPLAAVTPMPEVAVPAPVPVPLPGPAPAETALSAPTVAPAPAEPAKPTGPPARGDATPTKTDPGKNGTKLPGKSGGANMPIGTPSKGGTVGVPTGARQIGDPEAPYPLDALRRGLEGRPQVWLRISTTGEVVEVKLHKSCGYDILDQAALRYVKTLRFRAATRDGVPVESACIKPVRYTIE